MHAGEALLFSVAWVLVAWIWWRLFSSALALSSPVPDWKTVVGTVSKHFARLSEDEEAHDDDDFDRHYLLRPPSSSTGTCGSAETNGLIARLNKLMSCLPIPIIKTVQDSTKTQAMEVHDNNEDLIASHLQSLFQHRDPARSTDDTSAIRKPRPVAMDLAYREEVDAMSKLAALEGLGSLASTSPLLSNDKSDMPRGFDAESSSQGTFSERAADAADAADGLSSIPETCDWLEGYMPPSNLWQTQVQPEGTTSPFLSNDTSYTPWRADAASSSQGTFSERAVDAAETLSSSIMDCGIVAADSNVETCDSEQDDTPSANQCQTQVQPARSMSPLPSQDNSDLVQGLETESSLQDTFSERAADADALSSTPAPHRDVMADVKEETSDSKLEPTLPMNLYRSPPQQERLERIQRRPVEEPSKVQVLSRGAQPKESSGTGKSRVVPPPTNLSGIPGTRADRETPAAVAIAGAAVSQVEAAPSKDLRPKANPAPSVAVAKRPVASTDVQPPVPASKTLARVAQKAITREPPPVPPPTRSAFLKQAQARGVVLEPESTGAHLERSSVERRWAPAGSAHDPKRLAIVAPELAEAAMVAPEPAEAGSFNRPSPVAKKECKVNVLRHRTQRRVGDIDKLDEIHEMSPVWRPTLRTTSVAANEVAAKDAGAKDAVAKAGAAASAAVRPTSAGSNRV